jgi:hypothetical protein
MPRNLYGQEADPVLAEIGKFQVEEYNQYRRLLHNGILRASQVRHYYLLRADSPIPFGSFSPWDVVLLEGAVKAWDPTLEPLAYYHRTGPVGAVFAELRTRKGGADAAAPVGVIGLDAVSVACYARPGQKVTFYETHPELKALVADTDRYFTIIADARKRGAEIDLRMGPIRKNLERDADRKYAVLLVELIDEGFDPGDRLTLEAVRLYADRVTPDGLVALHISNKEFRLEPVVARIAEELKLAARIWEDDGERTPGKTASSWVVLARDKKALGSLGWFRPPELDEGVGLRRDGDTDWPAAVKRRPGPPKK